MNDDCRKYQYENLKNLYLSTYQRLLTIATLINSGGILSIATLLSGDTKDKYHVRYEMMCMSFYPLNVSLICFSIALLICFLIILIDFRLISSEFEKMTTQTVFSPNPWRRQIVKWQWRVGKVSIFFMIMGGILALTCVINQS